MGFGFLIERFGLFLHMQFSGEAQFIQRGASFWVGIIFIALGTVVAAVASVQYRRFVRTLKQGEIPEGYWVNVGALVNLALGVLGIGLVGYLVYGF
jgi:putative membrane protein